MDGGRLLRTSSVLLLGLGQYRGPHSSFVLYQKSARCLDFVEPLGSQVQRVWRQSSDPAEAQVVPGAVEAPYTFDLLKPSPGGWCTITCFSGGREDRGQVTCLGARSWEEWRPGFEPRRPRAESTLPVILYCPQPGLGGPNPLGPRHAEPAAPTSRGHTALSHLPLEPGFYGCRVTGAGSFQQEGQRHLAVK